MPSTAAKAVRMSKKDLEKYRRLLEEKKATLSADLAKTRSAEEETTEESTQDIADKAVSSYTREFLYSLTDGERSTLLQIDDALGRIEDGTYGLCVNCGTADDRKATARRFPGRRTAWTARSSPRRGCSPTRPAFKFLCSIGPRRSRRRGPCFLSCVRLRLVPKAAFSDKAVPGVLRRAAAILVTGDVEFFVEEAAARAREILRGQGRRGPAVRGRRAGRGGLRRAAQPLALLAAADRRARHLAASRHGGSRAAPDEGGRGLGGGQAPGGVQAGAGACSRRWICRSGLPRRPPKRRRKKVRRKDEAPLLAEILKELPEEKSGGAAVLRSALRSLLERSENDGTVALLTAVSPPAGVDLVREIADRGPRPRDARSATTRSRRSGGWPAARAKEREVVLEPAAVERLLARTDSRAAAFAMELEKLLEWAGKGGRIRASDIESNVEDESSEDVYAFFDAIGRRDAGDALARLERLLDGRDVRAGDRDFKKIEDIWPIQLLGMLAGEVRRMLLIRARLEEAGSASFDASMSYQTFQARVLPRLMAPAAPFGRSPFETAQGARAPVRSLPIGAALLEVHDAPARARSRAGRRRGRRS